MQKYKNFTMSDAFERAYLELSQYEAAPLSLGTYLKNVGKFLKKIGASLQQAPSN